MHSGRKPATPGGLRPGTSKVSGIMPCNRDLRHVRRPTLARARPRRPFAAPALLSMRAAYKTCRLLELFCLLSLVLVLLLLQLTRILRCSLIVARAAHTRGHARERRLHGLPAPVLYTVQHDRFSRASRRDGGRAGRQRGNVNRGSNMNRGTSLIMQFPHPGDEHTSPHRLSVQRIYASPRPRMRRSSAVHVELPRFMLPLYLPTVPTTVLYSCWMSHVSPGHVCPVVPVRPGLGTRGLGIHSHARQSTRV